MKLLVGILVGTAVLVGAAVVFAEENKKKGGVYAIALKVPAAVANTDDVLNQLEQDFGWPLDAVATRFVSSSPQGTVFTVYFLPSHDTPAMPAVGKSGVTANGVPYQVASVTEQPVQT